MKKYRTFVLLQLLFLTGIHAAGNRPDWIHEAGSQNLHFRSKTLFANDFGAENDTTSLSTKAIQQAIDNCAKQGGGTVRLKPGTYLTGSLFLKSNVQLQLDKGVTLLGSSDLRDYPEIDTRIAGIEMRWPAALINIIGQENAAVSGKGIVDGRGKPFWDSYWKLRADYQPKGLRWIVDYDAKRPRALLISDSKNIQLSGITLQRSGFWTVQVLYSEKITVRGIRIRNNLGGHGPSTDGIDIDSSVRVLVENCDIDCNDDNFCLKAGRDADGLRVNRPCEYIVIRKCKAGAGGGLITCGSETSGSIRNVWVEDLTASGTQCGVRIKSALNRGGVVENIFICKLKMRNVATPIEVTTNWNPAYSYSRLPEGMNPDSVPEHWRKMLQEVRPASAGIPVFRNIHIQDVKATGARQALNVSGMPESVVNAFFLKNLTLRAASAGSLNYCRDWTLQNVQLISPDSLIITNCSGLKRQ